MHFLMMMMMQLAMNLITVCRMFIWCSLWVSVCMLTVLNALLRSSATVCSGGLFWLKPVSMVLFMMCGMVFVMYGSSVFSRLQTTQPTSGGAVTVVSSCCANCVEPPAPSNGGPIYRVFSSVFAITERSEMGLYNVPYVHVFVWFWNWYDVC